MLVLGTTVLRIQRHTPVKQLIAMLANSMMDSSQDVLVRGTDNTESERLDNLPEVCLVSPVAAGKDCEQYPYPLAKLDMFLQPSFQVGHGTLERQYISCARPGDHALVGWHGSPGP